MVRPINGMWGAVMVWLISYIFFLLTLANNFSASHDSINYLNGIVRGEHLFHPHHLLYNFYAYLWLILFKNIFQGAADHYIIESFTAVWGSGILAVSYLFFPEPLQSYKRIVGFRHYPDRFFIWNMVLQRKHRGLCTTGIFYHVYVVYHY